MERKLTKQSGVASEGRAMVESALGRDVNAWKWTEEGA